jgi:inosine-uridine nucleoside N-ribohydrolase
MKPARFTPMQHRLTIANVLGIVLVLVATACSGSVTPGESRSPVIVDYSPTQSDIGALLFVLASRDVEVLAITIPGTGESHCEHAVATTRAILDMLGVEQLPVACGRDQPLGGTNAFPEEWRRAADRVSGLDVTPFDRGESGDAVQLLRSSIEGATQPVTLLTLGPLTNVGEFLAAQPGLVSRIAHVYVMGGAVNVEGNVIDSPAAEWNIWVDPRAANLVIQSGVPVTLIPLDATNDVPVDLSIFSSLLQPNASPAIGLMKDMAEASPDWYRSGEFYLWDELAAGAMVDESYVSFVSETIVIDEDGPEMGRTRPGEGGIWVRVAISADRVRFTNDLVSAWAGNAITVYEPMEPATAAYVSQLREAAGRYKESSEAAWEIAISEYPDLEFGEGTSLPDTRGFLRALVPGLLMANSDLLDILSALEAPTSVPAHAEYVAALAGVAASGRRLIAQIDSITSFEDLDALFASSAFDEAMDACFSLQNAASALGATIDFSC